MLQKSVESPDGLSLKALKGIKFPLNKRITHWLKDKEEVDLSGLRREGISEVRYGCS